VYKDEEPIIALSNVSKTYSEGVDALDDVSFSISKGEFVFIVGPSGSGKSTLIKLLLKEINPTSGKIEVFGKNCADIKRRHISRYRRNIGVVFQDFRLLNDRNVFENVALAQRVIGVSRWSMNRNVSSVLSLAGLTEKLRANPKELSGGEQQRVALARALVNRPSILLADEPTGNLDPKNAWSIMELLDEVNKLGTTVIVVTHNPDVVDMMQKRVIMMKDGKLIHDESKGGYLYERY
jgi:cell division ATP-binding protein ftsE